MNDYESSGQEPSGTESTKTEKRAEWEAFEFRVPVSGVVRVENVSHDESDDHVYVVELGGDEPESCTCPAFEYHCSGSERCKHMTAVANQPAVLLAAAADDDERAAACDGPEPTVMADGGVAIEPEPADEDDGETDAESTVDDYLDLGEVYEQETERPDDCRCDDQLGGDMVCSVCSQLGFATPNRSEEPTDYWGQSVKEFDSEPVGAGEKSECQSCGSRFDVSMVAATEDSDNRNWEEFYECQQCGATGSFRFFGSTDTRRWTGRMDYPERGL